MRHATLYHLRAFLRPLKRRVRKGKSRAIPCGNHRHHQSHSGYNPLLPFHDDDNDDRGPEGEDAIELLPPARPVTDPCLLIRPTSAPGPSPPSLSSSSLTLAPASASTCTLASSSPSACHPSLSFSPSCTTPTCTDRPVSAGCQKKEKEKKSSRRETWTKSLLALDSLFFENGGDVERTTAAAVDAHAAADGKKRPGVRESRRDSFMWMKFDGHTGGAVAWADGARLAAGAGWGV
ncbi:uncharacterized protein BKCO1_3500075 [Diplodia corticola]|uniref:Uncharacterized protein n=1 Tax=Diplodia corticola TaxID=236234 RepID=A0A1J9RZJ0_9PEZI|nr:uncharacterized protein BKCO1_3500075 [Diplodia corticola]OJD32869.1 hypothetical protein BKCO1_3500075 [Diplodia corticola]